MFEKMSYVSEKMSGLGKYVQESAQESGLDELIIILAGVGAIIGVEALLIKNIIYKAKISELNYLYRDFQELCEKTKAHELEYERYQQLIEGTEAALETGKFSSDLVTELAHVPHLSIMHIADNRSHSIDNHSHPRMCNITVQYEHVERILANYASPYNFPSVILDVLKKNQENFAEYKNVNLGEERKKCRAAIIEKTPKRFWKGVRKHSKDLLARLDSFKVEGAEI